MNRERFLVKSNGDDINGTRAGLVKIIELLGQHTEAVIVVPQLGGVKNSMLATVLGEDYANILIKNRELLFAGGKKLSLCSEATLKNYQYANAYLALWGSKYTIESIETLSRWQAVVLVTWQPEDSIEWESKYKVETICPT